MSPTSSVAEARSSRRWLALGVIAAAQFMVIMYTSIIGVALPKMQHDLGFTPQGLSWVFNAYVVAFGGLLLLGGRLSDLFGARRIFSIGWAVLAVGSWRLLFVVSIPLVLVALMLLERLHPSQDELLQRTPVDYAGIALFVALLAGVTLQTVRRDRNGDNKPDQWEQYIGGVPTAITYDDDYDGKVDRRDDNPGGAPQAQAPVQEPTAQPPTAAPTTSTTPAPTTAPATPAPAPKKP